MKDIGNVLGNAINITWESCYQIVCMCVFGMRLCLCICIYMYIYACICVYVCIHIYLFLFDYMFMCVFNNFLFGPSWSSNFNFLVYLLVDWIKKNCSFLLALLFIALIEYCSFLPFFLSWFKF